MVRKAHASPQKEFFIEMITRDITLEACILDLIDNSVDGAIRANKRKNANSTFRDDLSGYRVDISFSEDKFEIDDNCGGIAVNDAVDYAFHFGRRPDIPEGLETVIGLYGIGMKRAIFKIGRIIEIVSNDGIDPFLVPINVDTWKKQTRMLGGEQIADWDFDLRSYDGPHAIGTNIEITEINPSVKKDLASPVYNRDLRAAVAKYYSFLLLQGLTISINRENVEPYPYRLKHSEEFQAANVKFEIDGVETQIIVGMSDLPADEEEPGASSRAETNYFGWYVVCNGRIVIAADKTSRTVWGDDYFPAWHGQYNGFMGQVFFESDDPAMLPWTTTKREIDADAPVYRQAVTRMKEFSREFIQYTHARKTRLEQAKAAERDAEAVALKESPKSASIRLPHLERVGGSTYSRIQYSKSKEQIARAKRLLGNPTMSNVRVGELTFDYYLEQEGEDE